MPGATALLRTRTRRSSPLRSCSVTSSNGFTTRQFELKVRNRASSPQKFGAVIRVYDRNRNELRTRTVREFILPPYAETRIEQSLSMPDRLSAQITDSTADVELIPWEQE